jgi:protein glucosyltransferase
MHSGAVIFKPDSVFSEWYYHLLRPWVHYVPVREYLEDAVEQAAWLLQRAPAAASSCLAANAKAFARQHIRREAVACYWWRLLSAWAKQQPQGSRTEGFRPA